MMMWHRVIEIIGFENASALRKEFGGERVYIPDRETKEIIIPIVKEMLKTKSYRAVAKELGISPKTVWRYSLMD